MRSRLLRALIRQLRSGWRRAAVLGTGILVAATAFSLLTAATDTSEARVRGTVAANFTSSYDLLIRPPGSQTPLERDRGLIRNNFESGIYGGITVQQWRRIRSIPGVAVAAPVAYLGWVNQLAQVKVPVGRYLSLDQPVRVRTLTSAQAGRPAEWAVHEYLVVTRSNLCPGVFVQAPPQRDAFSPRDFGICLTVGGDGQQNSGHVKSVRTTELDAVLSFPMLVAAVDPDQENKLLGLDQAVTTGRPLAGSMTFTNGPSGPVLPVLASSRSFRTQTTTLSVERLQLPGPHPERALAAAPPSDPDLTDATTNWARLNATPSTPVGSFTFTAGQMYAALRHAWTTPIGSFQRSPVAISWAAGPVAYQANSDGSLSPKVVTNDPVSTWRNQNDDPLNPFWLPAPENADTQFRRLTPQPYVGPAGPNGSYGRIDFRLVGDYDPEKLPGFSELSKVPLETYRAPVVQPGDATTRRLLQEKPLGPTSNLGGYVAQPPFLLTTLSAAEGMTGPTWFGTRSGKPLPNSDAPISVIRVKVRGVTGPDDASIVRLQAAATTITRVTGLTVDVTAGSSPQNQTIRLPATTFGAPKMTVTEGWTRKGVALLIVAAADRKSVLLFGLILAITVSFLGSASYAAVRGRRGEIGTLATLGWSPRQVAQLVVGELAVVGALAGTVGAALSAVIIQATGLNLSPGRVLLIPPVALALALAAGAIPSVAASRVAPIAALRPMVSDARRARRRPRGVLSYAIVGVLRRPGRTTMAAAPLAVSVACLGALFAVSLGFQGTVSGSLLGDFVTVQVRGVDYVSAALSTALAGFCVADLLALTLRERVVELATLKTTGWSARHLVQVAVTEAASVAALGAGPGACIAAAAALALCVPAATAAAGAAAAAACGVATVLVFSAVPTVGVRRLNMTAALADD